MFMSYNMALGHFYSQLSTKLLAGQIVVNNGDTLGKI